MCKAAHHPHPPGCAAVELEAAAAAAQSNVCPTLNCIAYEHRIVVVAIIGP